MMELLTLEHQVEEANLSERALAMRLVRGRGKKGADAVTWVGQVRRPQTVQDQHLWTRVSFYAKFERLASHSSLLTFV